MMHTAELERSPTFVAGDLQIEFRRLQKRLAPGLTDAERMDLFVIWLDGHRAWLRREAEEGQRKLMAIAQDIASVLAKGKPFVCVCGVEGDPSDPGFEIIHREHFHVAGLDKALR